MAIIWGIVGNSHDASLAVLKCGPAGLTHRFRAVPLWARLSKQYSGIEHDPDLNDEIVKAALAVAGPPDQVVWYEKPCLKTLRQWRAGQGWLWEENNIKKYLKRWNITAPIAYTKHHNSHAAYAYYTQGDPDTAVICLDSIGEFECLTIWQGQPGWKLRKVYSQSYPHSLGLFYSAMTQRVGLVPQRDEYMLVDMGGNIRSEILVAMLEEIINFQNHAPHIMMKENLHRGCQWWHPEWNSEQDLKDIAATTQEVFEGALMVLSARAQRLTGNKNLALAGGGALNRQAVDRIREDWNSIHVPPNPGDPGSCIGSVLWKFRKPVSLEGVWGN
jgi:carbamoyltransferase